VEEEADEGEGKWDEWSERGGEKRKRLFEVEEEGEAMLSKDRFDEDVRDCKEGLEEEATEG
jgi:hypothetical protein